MQQQPEHPGLFDEAKNGRALVLVLCGAFAKTWEVFLHRRFGERYLSGGWVLAITLIGLIVAVLLDDNARRMHQPVAWRNDPRALLWFFGLFCLVGILHRTTIRWRAYHGDAEHSCYTGWPWAMRAFGKQVPENFVKCLFEPALAVGISLAVQRWNEPLGSYLLVATAGLFLHANVARALNRQTAVHLADAEQEMTVRHEDAARMTGRDGARNRASEVAQVADGAGQHATVSEAIERLPPELKRLLDSSQGGRAS